MARIPTLAVLMLVILNGVTTSPPPQQQQQQQNPPPDQQQQQQQQQNPPPDQQQQQQQQQKHPLPEQQQQQQQEQHHPPEQQQQQQQQHEQPPPEQQQQQHEHPPPEQQQQQQQQQQERVDYSGWQVLQISLPSSKTVRPTQPTFLDLRASEAPRDIDILSKNRLRGQAEVAVSSRILHPFTRDLRDKGIPYTVLVEDLATLLEQHPPTLRTETTLKGAVTFTRFMKYEEIMTYLHSLPSTYPDLVTLREVGRSVEGRPIYLLIITSSTTTTSTSTTTNTTTSSTTEKPVIFVEGGVHPREWISHSAALNILRHLLTSPDLTHDLEWRVMPMANPDGYITTWTTDRLWRKNRSFNNKTKCFGVDLNRNFGYHWAETGSSQYPCSSVYHGPTAFSEPETRILRDTLMEKINTTMAYVDIHAYGQLILHPWAYTLERKDNHKEMTRIARGMARVIEKEESVYYITGAAADVLYTVSGTTIDWMAGLGKVPLVYAMELRANEGHNVFKGFLLPDHLITPSVNDAWLAVRYLAKQVLKMPPLVTSAKGPGSTSYPPSKTTTTKRPTVYSPTVMASKYPIKTTTRRPTTYPPSTSKYPIKTTTSRPSAYPPSTSKYPIKTTTNVVSPDSDTVTTARTLTTTKISGTSSSPTGNNDWKTNVTASAFAKPSSTTEGVPFFPPSLSDGTTQTAFPTSNIHPTNPGSLLPAKNENRTVFPFSGVTTNGPKATENDSMLPNDCNMTTEATISLEEEKPSLESSTIRVYTLRGVYGPPTTGYQPSYLFGNPQPAFYPFIRRHTYVNNQYNRFSSSSSSSSSSEERSSEEHHFPAYMKGVASGEERFWPTRGRK